MDVLRKLLVVAILAGGAYGFYYTKTKSAGGTPVGIGALTGGSQPESYGGDRVPGEGFEEVKSQGFDQVFRFDVKPGWVLSNWRRVTTGLSDADRQGYRVLLVTGTGEADLAGSLTYYFDNLQRLERITFTGATGDYRPLVAFLETRYGFRRQVTTDARIVTYSVPQPRLRMDKRPRQSISRLLITPAPVISRNNPNGRFAVELIIEMRLPPVDKKSAALGRVDR